MRRAVTQSQSVGLAIDDVEVSFNGFAICCEVRLTVLADWESERRGW